MAFAFPRVAKLNRNVAKNRAIRLSVAEGEEVLHDCCCC